MPQIPSLPLSSGASIPQLGLGTYKITGPSTQKIVESALEVGYRHIDTAQMYYNEAEVGAGLAASGIAREELFVTTKLNTGNHDPDVARRSFDESLEKLGLDYVDLFLIHWPMPRLYSGDFPATWRVLQEFMADGRARTVGVSNFEIHHLRRLVDEIGVMPAVNQIEAHPALPNDEVREWTKARGGVIEAWSPLSRGRILTDPQLVAVASELDRTPSQLVLRWHIERGDVVFPKTTHMDRMRENMAIFDFELTDSARSAIAAMDRGEAGRTGKHPDVMNEIR